MPKEPIVRNAGLLSDGELVQASADVFELRSEARTGSDAGHDAWIEILSVSPPTSRTSGDDDGLPDTIIWCIDGNGTGTTQSEEFMITHEYLDRTWSVNGEPVDDAGMSALLFL